MVVPRKNLLEAFRDAGNRPAQEAEPAAGPFARSEAPAAPRARAARRMALPGWLPWACGVGLAFVLGLALGRSGASVAAAPETTREERPAVAPAERSAPAVREAPPLAGAAPAAAPGGVAPLYDQANRYTIVVITYGASKQDFAWATHDLLLDKGYPVWPVAQRGSNYLVLVGAAPDAKALEPTLADLRRLASWDGTPAAFADAYVDRIDRIVER